MDIQGFLDQIRSKLVLAHERSKYWEKRQEDMASKRQYKIKEVAEMGKELEIIERRYKAAGQQDDDIEKNLLEQKSFLKEVNNEISKLNQEALELSLEIQMMTMEIDYTFKEIMKIQEIYSRMILG